MISLEVFFKEILKIFGRNQTNYGKLR